MANKRNNKVIPDLKASDFHKKQSDLLQLFREINHIMLSPSSDLEFTLDEILRICTKFINASYGLLLLLDGQKLVVEATTTNSAREELGRELSIANSVPGIAVERIQTILIPDLDIEPRYLRILYKERMRSAIAVPLIEDGRVFGVLYLESPVLDAFSERDKELLETVADQVAILINIARSQQGLFALQKMDRALLRAADVKEQIFDVILENCLKLMNSAHGQILLLKGPELIIKATSTVPADKELGMRIEVNKSTIGWAVLFQKSMIISDVSSEPLYQRIMDTEYMRSEIVVPFIQDGTVIGVLNIESPILDAFSQADKVLLEAFADQAAITIKTEPLRQLKVFLCHASGDKPQIRKLYNRLISYNLKPWFDEVDLLPGQDWQLEIPQAVRDSDIVLVCLSQSSVSKAGYVHREIKYALDVADEQPEGVIFLIPVRLEKCEVPNQLKKWQWVDLFDEKGYQRLLDTLISRANRLKDSS